MSSLRLKLTNISLIKIFFKILELANSEGKSSLHSTVGGMQIYQPGTPWSERYHDAILCQIASWITFFLKNFDLHKTSVYHVHNSALDSKSSFNESSLAKSFD